MKRSQVLLFTATVAAGGAVGLGYRLFAGKSKAIAVDGAPLALKDDESMAREVESLKIQLRSLRGQVQAQAARKEAGGKNAPADPANTLTRAERRAKEEQRHREAMAQLESSFRSEAADAQWGPTVATTIAATLKAEEVGIGEARSIDCRSHTCRVELHDDGSGKLDPGLAELMPNLSGTLNRMYVNRADDPAGGKSVVLYLVRDEPVPLGESREARR